MPRRQQQSSLAGQSRRSASLGADDPRTRRGSQGFAGAEFFIGEGLEKGRHGELKVIDALLDLIVDSGAGAGAGVTSLFPWWGYKTGRWYRDPMLLDAGGVALTADRIYFVPLAVYDNIKIDRIGFYVSGAGAAGTLARVGIYKRGADGKPGKLLFDAGTVLVDATGAREVTFDPLVVPFGSYWLAYVSNGAPTAYAVRRGEDQYSPMGYGALSDVISYPCWYGAFTYATLPGDAADYATTLSTTAGNYPPALAIRLYATGVTVPGSSPGPGTGVELIIT